MRLYEEYNQFNSNATYSIKFNKFMGYNIEVINNLNKKRHEEFYEEAVEEGLFNIDNLKNKINK